MEEELLREVPVLVFANKQDLEMSLDAEEITGSLKLGEISDRMWTI